MSARKGSRPAHEAFDLVAAQSAAPRKLAGQPTQRARVKLKKPTHLVAQLRLVIIRLEQLGDLLEVGAVADWLTVEDGALGLAASNQNTDKVKARMRSSAHQIVTRALADLNARQREIERDGHEGMPALMHGNQVVSHSATFKETGHAKEAPTTITRPVLPVGATESVERRWRKWTVEPWGCKNSVRPSLLRRHLPAAPGDKSRSAGCGSCFQNPSLTAGRAPATMS
jgi:hypothetical protein